MHDVTKYAQEVVSGERIASKKVTKACKRHLSDLEKAKNSDYPYEFDEKKADKIIKFIQLLPDVSTGAPVILAMFQKFIVGSLFGWVHKKTGHRRFTKAYVSMARKQGKSVLVAGIVLYEFLYGESPSLDRQIMLTANTRDQAKIVYKMVQQQLSKVQSKSKAIKRLTKIKRDEIAYDKTFSVIRPLSKDAKQDGLNVLIGVLDEWHLSPNTDMMEVLESSQGQQKQPLILIISTAGFDMNAPMYTKEYPYVTRILDGDIENDNYFAFVAEQDSEEEIHDESLWIKSNPLLEVKSLNKLLMRNLRKKLKEAQEKDDVSPTLVKNFNIWQSASEESYIKTRDWEACHVEQKPDINGTPTWIGMDMSRFDDLTALSFIHATEDGKFYVDNHSFVGTKGGLDAKIKRDMIDYRKLEKNGHVTITDRDSGIINYKQVQDYLNNYVQKHDLNVQAICYDRALASNIVTDLEDTYTMIDVPQNFMNLSESIKQFRLQVYEKNIMHDGNPNLTIAVNNAITRGDNNGNIILDKKKNRNKIDPIVALVTAYTQAMHHDFDANPMSADERIMSGDFGF